MAVQKKISRKIKILKNFLALDVSHLLSDKKVFLVQRYFWQRVLRARNFFN
jgi:hypothetical protein